MTQKDFDAAIARLLRRIELLRRARNGSIKLRAIDIPRCVVHGHTRGAHVRHIAPKGWSINRFAGYGKKVDL